MDVTQQLSRNSERTLRQTDQRWRSTASAQYGSKQVDFVWIDQEHSPMSPEALQGHILAAHGTLTRIPARPLPSRSSDNWDRFIACCCCVVAGFGSRCFPGRGLAVIVRVQGPNSAYTPSGGVTQPWGTWIKAALDAGADGVIVPQVRSADEVRTIVGACNQEQSRLVTRLASPRLTSTACGHR